MLKFGNKEFRNLQEQVLKNMSDIQDIIEGNALLANFGIKVVGQVEAVSDLPDPATYEGDYGDAYLVGMQTPYSYYIFTRAFEGQEQPSWFNLGQFPVPGPQGPKGDKGDTGNAATMSVGTVLTNTVSPGQQAHVAINSSGTSGKRIISFAFDIPQGQQGVQGQKGDTGDTGPQGPQGIQGEKGDSGNLYTILGKFNSASYLPDPHNTSRTGAYLVGTQAPYDVYVIIGTGSDLEWINLGPVATTSVPYYVLTADYATKGTVEQMTLQDIADEPGAHFVQVGDYVFAYGFKHGGTNHYYSLGANEKDVRPSELLLNMNSGAWVINYYSVAQTEGEYLNMTVGLADQLAATIGDENSDCYSFRPTGGSASVGNRATMKKIQAVSVVKNQLARMQQSISGRGLTATYQGGNVYKINGTYDSSIAPVFNLWQNYPYIYNEHTYLVVINLTNCPASTKVFNWNFGSERRTQSFIRKASLNGKSTVTFQVEADEGTVFSDAIVESALIDLTLFFGSNDRIPEGFTVADFLALVGNAPIEYNEGTLASTDLSGFETVGYNMLKIDGRMKGNAGEWSKNSVRPNLSEREYYVGMTANNIYNEERIASYSFIQNGLKINSKEAGYGIGFPVKVIGGQEYNLEGKSSQGNFAQRIGWYDKSGHLIKFDIFDVSYIPYAVAPINAYWALIVLAPRSENVDTEITDVSFHLKRSGSRTGYEPYEKHDYSISFQGNGIFPDSNNNAETTGDELTPDGKIARNFGIIDMGEIDWNYDNVNKRFISNDVNNYSDLIKHITSSSVVPNILCSKYAVSSFDLLLDNEKAIALHTNDLFYLRDTDYENSADLKASLSGVKIIFQLENPTSEKSAPYNKNVVVDDYGTERFLGKVPIARPTTLYQADLAEFVQSLYTSSGGNAPSIAIGPNIPNPPASGTCVLKSVDGAISWVAE